MKKQCREKYPKISVVLLLATYVVLSLASSFATKLAYGPDEPAHFIYVREIGEYFRLPGLAHEDTRDISLHISHEAHQPPLYYVITAIPYYIASKAGAETDTIWTILRLFTVLIGACWVYFLYRLSREFLGKQRYVAVLSAACVGLLPMSTYIGGVVNNDVLACTTFTAALWLIIKTIRRKKITRKDAIAIGITSGLSILTKAQGIFLLPVVLLTALFIARSNKWKELRPLIFYTVASIMIAVIIGGIWFIRNWFVYDQLIIQSLNSPLVTITDGFGLTGWITAISFISDQLFKCFWLPRWLVPSLSREFPLYSSIYTISLLSLCIIIIVGVIGHLYRNRKNRVGKLGDRTDAWLLLIIPGILIYISLFRHTLLVDKGTLAQGRLLLPAAGVFGIGLVKCIQTFQKPSVRKILGLLIITALIISNLLVLRSIIQYYQLN